MEVRNAAGRWVSLLLNEDLALSRHHYSQDAAYRTIHSATSPRSGSSSPTTPELWRSDSYNSQMSNTNVISPLTTSGDSDYLRSASVRPRKVTEGSVRKRPVRLDASGANSRDDESAARTSSRPAKRYPCRFRDSHGCEKTFTTSGHASRHCKIHTAEKAVQCTFPSCPKRFTRADNMKQHLDTHYKDKSRSANHRGQKPTTADSRRNSTLSRRRSFTTTIDSFSELGLRQCARPTPPIASPNSPAPRSTWGVRAINLPMYSRPITAEAPENGLVALAEAVACQKGN